MMSQQQYENNMLLEQQADIEEAISKAWKHESTDEDICLICWASGVEFETIKRQDNNHGK